MDVNFTFLDCQKVRGWLVIEVTVWRLVCIGVNATKFYVVYHFRVKMSGSLSFVL